MQSGTITDNYAVRGGGVYVEDAPQPLFYSAPFGRQPGGIRRRGVRSLPSATRNTNPHFERCKFSGNPAS